METEINIIRSSQFMHKIECDKNLISFHDKKKCFKIIGSVSIL